MPEKFCKHLGIFGKIMDKRSLGWHDINRVNGHYMFGIAEKAIILLEK